MIEKNFVKQILTIMLMLAMTIGSSAQQVTDTSDAQAEPLIRVRGCRVGTPNPLFKPRRAQSLRSTVSPYIGNRRQLVVLASFQDQDFMEDHEATLQKWNKIFNAENYTENSFVGSVHDYFMAQSYGKFNLMFDLIFVELPDNLQKYHSTEEHDENSQYMVDDIVDVLQTQGIDWSIYDWDGDAFVDQLLIIYAGRGMNETNTPKTIWPHQWWLSQHLLNWTEDENTYRSYRTVMHDDKEYYVDCYCCVQEFIETASISTFGTICHEYTHCFGFPDFYYGYGNRVVGYWDLMDYGNYNGYGYRPCGYSAHERMLMGWLAPVELNSTTTITQMPALVDEPVAYLIRNDGAENEYYIVENRQQKGWDEDLPGSGIIVCHIEYDKDIWCSTTVSPNSSRRKRYQIFPANNNFNVSASSEWVYPYVLQDRLGNKSVANDSLTNTSVPAATLLNPNTDGQRLMSKPITSMAVDANGMASFVFMDGTEMSVHDVSLNPEQEHNAATSIYDLQGRRLSKPMKGLYIRDGKLYFVE